MKQIDDLKKEYAKEFYLRLSGNRWAEKQLGDSWEYIDIWEWFEPRIIKIMKGMK